MMVATVQKKLVFIVVSIVCLCLLGYGVLESKKSKQSNDVMKTIQSEPITISRRTHASFDTSVADELENKVKILCWVNTHIKNLEKIKAVKETWGRRCNKLIFVGDHTDEDIPLIGFDTREGRDYLVSKIFKAFAYVYENHVEEYDWFMRADDDVYIVMENLRQLLTSYNTNEPWYIGRPYNFITKQGFNSGGAGFVLSKRALTMLHDQGPASCSNYNLQVGWADDAELGKCMYQLGIKIADTRDRLNNSRFHPLRPEQQFSGSYCVGNKKQNLMRYNCPKGLETISEQLISFHHLAPREMYTFEILLYFTRPYGITHKVRDVNKLDDINTDKTVKKEERDFQPTWIKV